MKKFIKYPSIEQFRSVVKHVTSQFQFMGFDYNGEPIYDKMVKLPTLTFEGRVKLHGTNASICFNYQGGLWCQSRNNIITPLDDNVGFAFYVEVNKNDILKSLESIVQAYDIDLNVNTISLYGEWCGGNIQKGVAINGLPKMFVVFGCKVTPFNLSDKIPAYWVDSYIPYNKEINLFHIDDFWKKQIAIDFNSPAKVTNDLIAITEQVEAECPVGKFFGVSGIGEGVVWSYHCDDGSLLNFKVKGEKHSSSKVKKLASVDIEKIKGVEAFVEYAVTPSRLAQGIEQVFTSINREPSKALTKDFIKWITSDILKEESDTLKENGLELSDVLGACSKKAANWFINNL